MLAESGRPAISSIGLAMLLTLWRPSSFIAQNIFLEQTHKQPPMQATARMASASLVTGDRGSGDPRLFEVNPSRVQWAGAFFGYGSDSVYGSRSASGLKSAAW